MRKRPRPDSCPCGSGALYKACCSQFHSGDVLAGTPSELVRSRYAAYARGVVDYIIDTTDPSGPRWEDDVRTWRRSILDFGKNYEFRKLEILSASEGGDSGEVTFAVTLIGKEDNSDGSFSETSQFRKSDGRWLYVDGNT